MKYLSIVLVILVALFTVNIESIISYGEDDVQVLQNNTSSNLEEIEELENIDFTYGLKSIKEVSTDSASLSSSDIMFIKQPTIGSEGEEEINQRKIFFFGKPVDYSTSPDINSSEGTNWEEWTNNYSPSSNENSENVTEPSTPIEVNFERFLRGE